MPTIIADNGGYDSADLIAILRAAHTDGKARHGLGKTIVDCYSSLTAAVPVLFGVMHLNVTVTGCRVVNIRFAQLMSTVHMFVTTY